MRSTSLVEERSARTEPPPKLALCVATDDSSKSTPRISPNPASSSPRLVPPAPQNRSTAMGLSSPFV